MDPSTPQEKPKPPANSREVPVVILAGGSGTRMGTLDKCLLPFGQKTLLEQLKSVLLKQTSRLILNANGDAERFGHYQLEIVGDTLGADKGPLAGIASTMDYLVKHPREPQQSAEQESPRPEWLVSAPGDGPFIPADYSKQLLNAARLEEVDIVFCSSQDKQHFVSAIWSTALAPKLRTYLESGGRSVKQFIRQTPHRVLDFSANKQEIDPFFNINTHEDYQKALEYHQNRPTII